MASWSDRIGGSVRGARCGLFAFFVLIHYQKPKLVKTLLGKTKNDVEGTLIFDICATGKPEEKLLVGRPHLLSIMHDKIANPTQGRARARELNQYNFRLRLC